MTAATNDSTIGQSTTPAWEYCVEPCTDTGELQETLERRGLDGWELVSLIDRTGSQGSRVPAKSLRMRRDDVLTAIFKRPRIC